STDLDHARSTVRFLLITRLSSHTSDRKRGSVPRACVERRTASSPSRWQLRDCAHNAHWNALRPCELVCLSLATDATRRCPGRRAAAVPTVDAFDQKSTLSEEAIHMKRSGLQRWMMALAALALASSVQAQTTY